MGSEKSTQDIKILIFNKKPKENEEKKVSGIEQQNDNEGIVDAWLKEKHSNWIGESITKVIPELKAFLLEKGVTIISDKQNTDYQYEIVVRIPKNKP